MSGGEKSLAPYVVIVRAKLDKPFAEWAAAFDVERDAREINGVEQLFRHPVIGEQAVVFGMRTAHPRMVHDMMYHPLVRPGIELSGLVIGSEQILVLDGEA
jgi:hypothetical protein